MLYLQLECFSNARGEKPRQTMVTIFTDHITSIHATIDGKCKIYTTSGIGFQTSKDSYDEVMKWIEMQ